MFNALYKSISFTRVLSYEINTRKNETLGVSGIPNLFELRVSPTFGHCHFLLDCKVVQFSRNFF